MHVDVTVIESDDVAKAVAEELANCTINKLVIGAASQGMFTRYSSTRHSYYYLQENGKMFK